MFLLGDLRITRNGKEIDLGGLWSPSPGFLVCGGPSLNDHPLGRLKERGIVSLGVNQAAAWVPVKAWCFSDTQSKFHSALYLDPAVMTFSPEPKLKRGICYKTKDGFKSMTIRVRNCPNTYGFQRKSCFVPDTFFEDSFAHWGGSKHQPEGVKVIAGLCTMLIGFRLLHYLGVKTIYLLGVDFKGRDGLCYGFPEGKKERNRRYQGEYALLQALIPEFEKRNIKVFNCSSDTACDLFPYKSFDEAITHCKGSIEDEPLDTWWWYNMRDMQRDVEKNDKFTPVHYGEN